jgi:hypothetical protein
MEYNPKKIIFFEIANYQDIIPKIERKDLSNRALDTTITKKKGQNMDQKGT